MMVNCNLDTLYFHLKSHMIYFALINLFQASGASNAYTVKSLPGAYLYIPVLEPPMNSSTAAITSFSSVKRSLSDPEIHFTIPIPFGGHPIILTVNPTSDRKGINQNHTV